MWLQPFDRSMKPEVKDLVSELQFLGRNAGIQKLRLLIRTESERFRAPRLTSPVKSTSIVWYNAFLPSLPLLTHPSRDTAWKDMCSWVPAFHICSSRYQAGSKAWTLLCILFMEPFLVPFPRKTMEQKQLTPFTLLHFHHKKSRETFYLRLFWIQKEWRNQCSLIKPERGHFGSWR